MSLVNFYTSIFNKQINEKYFVKIFISSIVILLLSVFLLNKLDLSITENDLLRKYQLSKIDQNSFLNTKTIIVGDSSAGNAIDAEYFTKLSNSNTKNLALTGSWGILGSLGMIKNAYQRNNHIENIIIIHTLDIWNRTLPKESILELFPLKDMFNYLEPKDIISYYLNPKEAVWTIKYIVNKYILQKNDVEIVNDYLKQHDKKYSNKMLNIEKEDTLNSVKLSSDKLKELNLLIEFCNKNKLNCIFMNGPIHKQMLDQSNDFIQYKVNEIDKLVKINFIDEINKYENLQMGDSIDHIDPKYKQKVTKDYYKLVNTNLAN